MDTIRIDAGVKRIAINDDPERVITFNPSDVMFAERFYELLREFEAKEGEFAERAEQIDAVQEVDKDGLPVNFQDRLAFLHDVCTFMRERIDRLFGAGTSDKAFGDSLSLEMFEQFLTGITPFIQQARSERMKVYRPKRGKRVMKGT